MNEDGKRSTIKSLIQKWKVDLLCLQETKIQGINSSLVQQLWGNRWADWVELEAVGTKGDMIVIWDKRRSIKIESLQGCYTITCMLEISFENFRWCFTGIYGPHTNPEKKEMWDEMAGIMGESVGHRG